MKETFRSGASYIALRYWLSRRRRRIAPRGVPLALAASSLPPLTALQCVQPEAR